MVTAVLAVTASAAPAPLFQPYLAAARFSPVSNRAPLVAGCSTDAFEFLLLSTSVARLTCLMKCLCWVWYGATLVYVAKLCIKRGGEGRLLQCTVKMFDEMPM